MKVFLVLVGTHMSLYLFSGYTSEVYYALNVEYHKLMFGEAEPDYYKLPSEAELTPAEFQRMKEILLKAINKHNQLVYHNSDVSIEPLTKYGVQYKVLLTKKGEKEVWINGFCKESGFHFKNLDSEPVNVFDGGSCYFNTTINIKSGKTTPVKIHGFG